MSTLVTVVHVCTCVFLVLMVLIQSGKGAEISASFGGSSQTVFGSSGGANFFVKLTGALAAIFFTTSLLLTILATQSHKSLFEGMPVTNSTSQTAPAKPAVPAQGAAAPTEKK